MQITPVILTTGKREFSEQCSNILQQFRDCWVWIDQGEGAGAATKTAIAFALAHGIARDFVLFMEDDLEVHPTAGEHVWEVASNFPPDVGVVSFCDMREMSHKTSDGLYTVSALGCDGRGWWGNQALLIHVDVAKALVESDWFSTEINTLPGVLAHTVSYGDGGRNCSDIRMSYIVHQQPVRNKYAVSVPSVFRHIGYRSLCFESRPPTLGERETKNWIGDR